MELPGENSQDGSFGSQRSSSDPTARTSDRGGGSSASGSGDSYHYQPAASGSSGSQPANSGSGSGSGSYGPAQHSGSGSGSYGPAEHSGSGSGSGYYQDAQQSGSGSGSRSGGYYEGADHSGSGSGSSGRYYQPAEESSASGSHQAVDAGSYGSGSHRPGGSSTEHHSSSETKQTSSSRTGSSSVTWHETVSDAPKLSESEVASHRRSSSVFDDELSKTTDSTRSSLRRFKEGSKIFAGFIEDADGLQPSDDMLPPMTWEEKCEIIEELCLALEKRLDRLKNEKDGILDGLKNYFDVAEHICGMARKDRAEMQRNVIQFAELLNPSKKPYSEDMLRYLNGRILDKRLLKEKLDKFNKRLEKMVATATVQLESKLDVRELLHDSDFMEMRNLNEDLANQLDARARLLDKSRHVSRKIAKTAKALREEMDNKAVAKVSIRQSLSDRSPLVGKLQDLITNEYREKDRLHLEFLAFVKGEDLRPTAIEYMKIKQRSKSIRKELYNWLAKVEIAELKHTQLTKNIAMLETVAS